MVRVLHVNDFDVRHTAAGGAEQLVRRAIDGQRRSGLESDLFCIADVDDARRTAWRYVDNARARRALRERLHLWMPDIVHLHNIYHVLSPAVLGEIARYRRGDPCAVVMTAHDAHLVCPNPVLCTTRGGTFTAVDPGDPPTAPSIWRGPWDHRGVRHSWLRRTQHLWNYHLHGRQRIIDRVIAPSRFMAQLMHEAGLRTSVLPNPIPNRASSDDHASTGRTSDRLRLLYAGRIAREKGVLQLLRSLPAHLPLRLDIFGDGPHRDACERCVERRTLHDRVTFHGAHDHESILRAMAAAHVVIIPSLCHENAPLVAFEALSQRAELLLARRGGLPEIATDAGVGALFEPTEPSSLVAALESFSRRLDAGELNRFDVDRFLRSREETVWLDAMARAYDDVLERVRSRRCRPCVPE